MCKIKYRSSRENGRERTELVWTSLEKKNNDKIVEEIGELGVEGNL